MRYEAGGRRKPGNGNTFVTKTTTDEFARLLDAKHGVLLRLRELAERQVRIVSGGEVTKLLALLAAKQQQLAELQDLQRQLAPFRAQAPDARRWPSPAARERARETAAGCDAILSEILRLEKQCESELVDRRDAAAACWQGSQHAAQARTAYLQPSRPQDAQLDLSSET